MNESTVTQAQTVSHTRGPWTFDEKPDVKRVGLAVRFGLDTAGLTQFEICTVASTQHTDTHKGPTYIGVAYEEADARLIAAAPTMYFELERAADTFRDFSLVLRAIGKDVMSAAADIAERHIREQLSAIATNSVHAGEV